MEQANEGSDDERGPLGEKDPGSQVRWIYSVIKDTDSNSLVLPNQ